MKVVRIDPDTLASLIFRTDSAIQLIAGGKEVMAVLRLQGIMSDLQVYIECAKEEVTND